MKRLFFIHPFLFAIFPVLSLAAHNVVEVYLFSISPHTIFVILLSTLVLLLWLRYILKDGDKAAAIVSLFLFLFFSYGHFFELINKITIWGVDIGRHRYLYSVLIIFFTVTSYLIIKKGRNLHNLTVILTVVAVFLVIIPLVDIVNFELKSSFDQRDIESPQKLGYASADSKKAAKELPDIYYIILDRYAGQDALEEFYDFDNSEFIHYLKKKGFYVASESKANYLATHLSLASSLNLEYVDYLRERIGEDSTNMKPIFAKLYDYSLWRFLKAKGYKFIHFGSWWVPTIYNRYADRNVNLYFLTGLSRFLWERTMIFPLLYKLDIFTERWQQRRRILYEFEELAKVPDIEGPTFVFAHLLIPHPPFIFDRDGNFIKGPKAEQGPDEEGRKRLYIEQLIFTNKKIKVLIDKVISESELPPIIILQSEEGPYPIRFARDADQSFDWRKARPEEMRLKMSILNAYYLPDVNKGILYPSITPVNSFRVVFNLYFNTELELLPDRSYAFIDYKHPYTFFDITDRLKGD